MPAIAWSSSALCAPPPAVTAPAGRGWVVAEDAEKKQKQIPCGNDNKKSNSNGNNKGRFPVGMTTARTIVAMTEAEATTKASGTAGAAAGLSAIFSVLGNLLPSIGF